MQRSRGFTLVELMITVAILAILLGIAVPSFQTSIENNRVATQANEFIAALELAAAEVQRADVSNVVNISVTARSGSFQNGWCIYRGRDQDCNVVTPIVVHEAMENVVLNAVDGSGDEVTQFVFKPGGERGEMISPIATLTMRPSSCETDALRMRTLTVGVFLYRLASERAPCP